MFQRAPGKRGQTQVRAQPRPQRDRRPQTQDFKLPEELEKEVKEAFNFYDPERTGYISRSQLRSILGNFGYHNLNAKEIEEELQKEDYDTSKQTFQFKETVDIISKKWFVQNGKVQEAEEMFKLFDKKDKGAVGLNEIKSVFNQFLDIQISDNDIMEFISEADSKGDGFLNKQDFCAKMGYL